MKRNKQVDLEELLAESERPQQETEHTAGGWEIPDPTPKAPPVGYQKQKTMAEIIREQVRSHHLQMAAEAAGFETLEEADDFEVGDDYEPNTPYEEAGMEGPRTPPQAPAEPAGEGQQGGGGATPTPSPSGEAAPEAPQEPPAKPKTPAKKG